MFKETSQGYLLPKRGHFVPSKCEDGLFGGKQSGEWASAAFSCWMQFKEASKTPI